MRLFAKELVDLAPDLILSGNVPTTAALQRATDRISIVFLVVGDPVTQGFVDSFSHPGRNMTGFMAVDLPMGVKRLQFLKQMAPKVRRVALMFDPVVAGTHVATELRALETSAPLFNVQIIATQVRNATEIQSAMGELGRESDIGLLVAPDITTSVHRQLIADVAARQRMPAIYPYRYFVTVGGLASYGSDLSENYRLAAAYVDRMLKGEKASDLPVQAPTKFEFVINVNTSKALGLSIPPAVLALADEVIE